MEGDVGKMPPTCSFLHLRPLALAVLESAAEAPTVRLHQVDPVNWMRAGIQRSTRAGGQARGEIRTRVRVRVRVRRGAGGRSGRGVSHVAAARWGGSSER